MRTNGGAPHIDKDTGKQLSAKNIIIVFAHESEANDGYDVGQRMLYKVTGSNDAMVFLDGTVIKGTWEKKNPTSRMKFYDAAGKEISLNRGVDWVEVVPEGNDIVYK
jgi:hypothetical protein